MYLCQTWRKRLNQIDQIPFSTNSNWATSIDVADIAALNDHGIFMLWSVLLVKF